MRIPRHEGLRELWQRDKGPESRFSENPPDRHQQWAYARPEDIVYNDAGIPEYASFPWALITTSTRFTPEIWHTQEIEIPDGWYGGNMAPELCGALAMLYMFVGEMKEPIEKRALQPPALVFDIGNWRGVCRDFRRQVAVHENYRHERMSTLGALLAHELIHAASDRRYDGSAKAAAAYLREEVLCCIRSTQAWNRLNEQDETGELADYFRMISRRVDSSSIGQYVLTNKEWLEHAFGEEF